MQRLLGEIEFRDSLRAQDNIAHLSRDLNPELQGRFRSLIAASPDPDEALHYLERFHKEQPEAFKRVSASPLGLQILIAVFSYSRFLSEAVLSYPHWLDALLSPGELDRVLSSEELEARLDSFVRNEAQGEVSPLHLALFRRRQLLRTLVRDVLGISELADTAEEISNIADAVLNCCYKRIRQDLMARYGAPVSETDGTEAGFSIISLGKLGGKELNYSSDIDLMFVYSANGETAGPAKITNKEFFKKIANELTGLLSTYTAAGLCYRVDLRLRPDGRFGEVCISLDGAKSYYRSRARDWELQMLIKARISAGEREPGEELLDFVEPLIYSSTLEFSVVESASATRERIHEKAAARRGGNAGFNIKLTPGGIRDIEFLVQCLQRLHGGREQWVRHGGTLIALFRLRDKGLLSDTEYSRLASAYQFLRNLEHRLQFLEDRQTHTLPQDADSLAALALKMPGWELGVAHSAETLLSQLNQHLEEVQEIYQRVIHAQQPMYYTPATASAPDSPVTYADIAQERQTSNLIRFLDQRAPDLASTVSKTGLRRGATYFEHFLERILGNDEWLEWINSDEVLAAYLLDMFEHSPFLSEQLIRTPELITELRRVRETPGAEASYEFATSFEDPSELRRFFRREMFRIQCESICLQTPIFKTLERTSDLADAAIAGAYEMAIRQVAGTKGPSNAAYRPEGRMLAVTMGRLGMREFDLGSDADLVFVIPDEDSAELPFWTRVAERMISIITAYTGDGTIFTVDTRLRPNGREGALVQTEGTYKNYFANQAQAWEGITYMKCRAVAGDLERGTAFLNDLQEVDWRRYGQSGRSRKQLAQMRLRLEKEQGSGNPLKAGRGGYYDIDFALMYLRLKGAGIFYKVLNTPARIDVIEKMGHLERPDADFLRDAATFYRAVDHALRLLSGHAEGNLPKSQAQLEMLAALVRRWTPQHLHDQSLDVELSQIQTRTREFFDRLFNS